MSLISAGSISLDSTFKFLYWKVACSEKHEGREGGINFAVVFIFNVFPFLQQ